MELELTSLTLRGQEFFGKMDFKVLVDIQQSLKKIHGEKLTMSEMFAEIDEQNYAVIMEIIIQSIRRNHPQIKREYIEDRIGLADVSVVTSYVIELIGNSLPNG